MTADGQGVLMTAVAPGGRRRLTRHIVMDDVPGTRDRGGHLFGLSDAGQGAPCAGRLMEMSRTRPHG